MALPALESIAKVLAPLPNDIQVEGHTDNTPISTPRFPSNWELSAARASRVVRLFNDHAVASVRLVAVGYADTRNISPNTTPEGRAQNRRITVMILPRKLRNVGSVPAASQCRRSTGRGKSTDNTRMDPCCVRIESEPVLRLARLRPGRARAAPPASAACPSGP